MNRVVTTTVEGLMRVLTPNPAEHAVRELLHSADLTPIPPLKKKTSNYFIAKIANLKQ